MRAEGLPLRLGHSFQRSVFVFGDPRACCLRAVIGLHTTGEPIESPFVFYSLLDEPELNRVPNKINTLTRSLTQER